MENNDNSIHIGQRIKELLYHKKISNSELGRRIGKHNQNISTMLSKESITTNTLQLIMKATGITAIDIFGGEAETPNKSTEKILELYDKISKLQEKLDECRESSIQK